jgi:hypothetical protein
MTAAKRPASEQAIRDRREFLKRSALLVGTASAPLVITLAPEEAEAAGSWQPVQVARDCGPIRRFLRLCQ